MSQTTPDCKISQGVSKDGQTIRFVKPITIDSTIEAKSTLGIQTNATYSYIMVTLLAKAGLQKIENDLVIQFTDQSSIVVPLSLMEEITIQGMPGYTCGFVVLDKYVSQLKTKSVAAVIIQLSDKAFKSFDLKQRPSFLKDAANCLGLISY